ncbi:hypothetical protein BpJC7_19260 [Weizmannia acidilactici]|uniref:Uncharacterized protein n=1 Tax=Weizmannia acidilactici TaxID=2607726 RepID=A0A5J4JEW5_9BACI|nr:hypothetical protein [Weizmannia acidilactici]GER66741.1 hypothetical protein BpJC4_12120 [Weizmannia acidilactici]GER70623.1 hypothetical protein BpJC7_19260 [Weizmannia acidilactici]GER73796.1 hypothetical protein BpPP18_18630 [Weizmannia acidilactici]
MIPIIMGLGEMFKRIGFPAKYFPLLAVIFGLGFGIFYTGSNLKEGIIKGFMLGLSASGL